jgi:pimeloyl-ACP methyl ester carboxylesterase
MLLLLTVPSPASTIRAALDGHVKISGGHKLWYRVHRPDLLQGDHAPLIVCHGGPQVPSDYLFDLERVGPPARAVVFFDQLGCGRSSTPPADSGAYSLSSGVEHLRAVIANLDLRRYHLYGQSWGGLLAYLHLSTPVGDADDRMAQACSLTLSNTPTSVPLVEAEAGRLIDECGGEVSAFMAAHNFRGGTEQPPQLAAAYAHAGTTWRGTAAIAGLEASKEEMAKVACPAMVLRGEHDFCTEDCVKGWSALPNARLETLSGTSHHALLEDTPRYLALLGAFLEEHD